MNASALAYTLFSQYDQALLFRRLAMLQTDIVLFDDVEQLRWNGPTPGFATLGARLDGAVTGKKLRFRRGAQADGKVSDDASASEG